MIAEQSPRVGIREAAVLDDLHRRAVGIAFHAEVVHIADARVEHAQAESLTFDNGRLKGGSFNTDQGFGLRAVAGEAVGYAHAGELSLSALSRAADAVGFEYRR